MIEKYRNVVKSKSSILLRICQTLNKCNKKYGNKKTKFETKS